MPEGPSIIILKEQVDALHIVGQKVTTVYGNSKIDQERLIGAELTAVKSWGKHFLMCFKGFTLRVHFMLFGTYLINERKEKPVRLGLEFPGAEINFYTSSLQFIEGNLDDIYDWAADVMSDRWDENAAFEKLLKQPGMLVCDAILDQRIFAGAGNIIKNEVLYRIRLHPLSRIGELPVTKLKEMIGEVRLYSFDFLHWKKEFTLKKHWLAHTKRTCLRCNLPFIKAYLGKTNRRSFYCSNCQQLYGENSVACIPPC
jgi:endonuclease-8